MIVSLNDEKKKEKEECHFVYSSSGGEIGLEPLIIGARLSRHSLSACRSHQSVAIGDLKELLSSRIPPAFTDF